MRPTYETENDLSRERELINEWVCPNARKLPRSYGFDFMVKNESFVGGYSVWEVKVRSKLYKTWFISLLKLLKAQEYKALGITPYALVEIEGLAYRVDLLETPFRFGYGGRSDRGDPADREPMVHYKVSDMLRLVEPPNE